MLDEAAPYFTICLLANGITGMPAADQSHVRKSVKREYLPKQTVVLLTHARTGVPRFDIDESETASAYDDDDD